MATRQVLAELAAAYAASTGRAVAIDSVGGVDAAKRVAAGEGFDIVILAADAIDRLVAGGSVRAGTRRDLVRSPVAIAVRAGAARPDVASEPALREAVLGATSIGYSTGPSGTALLALFERWGIADRVRDRIVQAPPGIPVARLVAEGKVALGFQQLSEMQAQAGIDVLGVMPPGSEIVTTFSGGICSAAADSAAAAALLDFFTSPDADAAKQRHGMQPA